MRHAVNITAGLISLLLILMAISAAIGTVLPIFPQTAGIYVLLVLLCGCILIYSYCSKCPCRISGCGHILPGKLTRLFPKRKEGPYTWFDYGVTGLSIAAVVLVPFYWLIKTKLILIMYCVLLIVAGIIILTKECPACKNRYCFFSKKGKV
jgi:hypothetical protein